MKKKRTPAVKYAPQALCCALTLSVLSSTPALADDLPKAPSISDTTQKHSAAPVRVEFKPLTKNEKKKVFEIQAEREQENARKEAARQAQIAESQRLTTTQAPPPPSPSNAHSASHNEEVILPPDWEGFVDGVETIGSSTGSSVLPPLSSSTTILSSIVAPRYSDETAQKMIDYAYSQLGVPYLWGGTQSGVGLDCSGLTQNAYAAAGISIPRTTWDQINIGTHVSVSDAQPGDLVFYSSTGHVALYIGDGKVIHAPQPGEVVTIASIDMMPVEAVVRAV